MKEKTLQTKILRYLRQLSFSWWCKYPGGMYGQLGVPDIIGCYWGKFYAFEVKRPACKATAKSPAHPAGKPTKIQLKNIAEIIATGGQAHVVYSLQEVEDVINNT